MNKKELMKMVGNHKEIVNQYLEGKVSEEELKNTIGLYQTILLIHIRGSFPVRERQNLYIVLQNQWKMVISQWEIVFLKI